MGGKGAFCIDSFCRKRACGIRRNSNCDSGKAQCGKIFVNECAGRRGEGYCYRRRRDDERYPRGTYFTGRREPQCHGYGRDSQHRGCGGEDRRLPGNGGSKGG